MRRLSEVVTSTVVGGLFIVVPGVPGGPPVAQGHGLGGAAWYSPVAALVPDWLPAENLLSLLLVLVLCFAVGAAVRTRTGGRARAHGARVLRAASRYGLLRSLTQRLAGDDDETAWTPAPIEIEDALVPGIHHRRDRCGADVTVFVPSVPTPLAGAVYILNRRRVHPLDVPFTQAVRTISRWGAGSGELVRAMRRLEREAQAVGIAGTTPR